MAEGGQPPIHLHVENLHLDGLNAETFNVETLIQEQHVNQTTIERSEIHNLTLAGEGAAAAGNDEAINPEVQHDGPSNIPSNPGEHSPEETFNLNEWTKLSGTMYMFKKGALHPHTEVYQGRQKHDSGRIAEVVVKLVKETENCVREVDILLKLTDHPNIVKILESGKCSGTTPQIYIVMERCLQNLNEFIKENPFELFRATYFLQQIVLAIVFIHDNHIAHRDLKPSNILITLDGNNVKVSDFGISRELQYDRTQVTVTHPGAGTEGFKAPETYAGKPGFGYNGDIFSLGICGCIIISHGQHPFGPNPYMWTANIIKNKITNFPQIPKFPQPNAPDRSQLSKLLKRMLKPNPKDRLTALQIHGDQFFKGEPRTTLPLHKIGDKYFDKC